MRRSEINHLIRESKEFLDRMNFKLPPWAYFEPSQWKGNKVIFREIIENSLGWDITDFGSGAFNTCGLILFTLRNGSVSSGGKSYCEKIMIVREGQETPMHLHRAKMEDIINRGGGILEMELRESNSDLSFSEKNIKVQKDGIGITLSPDEKLFLEPGESITLHQGLYHRFFARKGLGKVLLGEVSSVNDDTGDNYFKNPVGRFPEIDEDEKPLHLLVSDYLSYI